MAMMSLEPDGLESNMAAADLSLVRRSRAWRLYHVDGGNH
jgi:hypothetical protein